MKIIPFIAGLAFLSLTSCGGGRKASASLEEADTLPMRYAQNLRIIRSAQFTKVELINPWDTTRLLHTYILTDRNKPLPASLPQGTVVRIPVQRAVVYSSVHGSLLRQIGALSSIGGLCDWKYVKDSLLLQACHDGRIAFTGDAMSPDIERIIELEPDLILLSPFENNTGYGKIEKLNIPIFEGADYMETSALGRAEWMKLYGMLTGREKCADSLFTVVEKNYLALKEEASRCTHHPKLLTELRYSGVWYVPCGQSSSGELYADAGIDYAFAHLPGSGSAALSFEQVYEQAHDADFWIIKYNQPTDRTYHGLKSEYAPYANFRPFKERKIFCCNSAHNAFFDETPFRPDWLIRDLIVISHPELLPNEKPRYFKPMEE